MTATTGALALFVLVLLILLWRLEKRLEISRRVINHHEMRLDNLESELRQLDRASWTAGPDDAAPVH